MADTPSTPPSAPAPTPSPAPLQTPATPAAPPKQAREVHQVVFITYPKLLFAWPILLLGFLLWPIGYAGHSEPAPAPAAPAVATEAAAPAAAPESGTVHVGRSHRLENLAWLYIWVAVFVIVAMGIDVNRNQFAFLVVVVGLMWIFGLWLRDVKGFTLFGDVYRWFANLDVQYDRNSALVVSILLSVPYALMLIWGRFNDYWRITHNEFEHYSLGRMDDSLGRGAKTMRTEFPDMFELILGLAGTLIVRDASGQREIRRIQHVMFLPFVRRKLNKVLEQMAVTTLPGALEEEEQQN
jgi:hypothetical protein